MERQKYHRNDALSSLPHPPRDKGVTWSITSNVNSDHLVRVVPARFFHFKFKDTIPPSWTNSSGKIFSVHENALPLSAKKTHSPYIHLSANVGLCLISDSDGCNVVLFLSILLHLLVGISLWKRAFPFIYLSPILLESVWTHGLLKSHGVIKLNFKNPQSSGDCSFLIALLTWYKLCLTETHFNFCLGSLQNLI